MDCKSMASLEYESSIARPPPEVIHTAERLLGVDDVEVDDGVHRHGHRVPGQDLSTNGENISCLFIQSINRFIVKQRDHSQQTAPPITQNCPMIILLSQKLKCGFALLSCHLKV